MINPGILATVYVAGVLTLPICVSIMVWTAQQWANWRYRNKAYKRCPTCQTYVLKEKEES